MAPEIRSTQARKTPTVDTFSFGVLTAEVAAEREPRPGDHVGIDSNGNPFFVSEPERRREDIDAVSSPRFRELISNLIVDNALKRWNASQIIDFLQSLIEPH